MIPKELMTTREVAEYLRIKERKVYELVSARRIPCSRVAGKWLFPKVLIDLWVIQHSEGIGQVKTAVERPPIISGSHDPLLEWCVRESGCELATMLNGSLDGIQRFAQGTVQCCGVHVFDPATGEYNRPLVRQTLAGLEVVLIEWAWREQGLIVAAGNPYNIRGIADLRDGALRLVERQEGAGSRLLFHHLLQQQQIDPATLHFLGPPVRSETDLALTIRDGKADVGFGIAAVARQCQVDFVPLQRERYDIVIQRRDYFNVPFQRLLAFTRTSRCADKAAELGGYDISGMGRVNYNSP
jgi:putative molybdopterin biosynthesis protein